MRLRHGSTKRSLLALLLALTMLALTAPARAETWGDWEFAVDSKGTAAITAYKGGGGDVQIPSTVTASGGVSYPVQSIGDNAFLECEDLRSVTIPDSVQSIGYQAFRGCTGLQSVTIPGSVQSIGISAFSVCTGLQSVTIGDGVQSIGSSAFADCTGLQSATIGDGVQSIGSLAFAGCTGLRSATIPGSVQSIGERAFLKCTSLQSVTIPDSVQSIGGGAFQDCTGLQSVTIGDGVQSIGSSAFADCTGLQSATIGDGVQSIGSYAFAGCTSLPSVTIPGSVQTIGDSAFRDCTSLRDIHFDGTEAGWQAVSKGEAAIPTGVTVHHDGWLVRLDANGGTVSPTSIRTGDDGKVSPLPAPTWTGHTFKGWFDALSGGRQVMDSTVITFPTTLWAIWEVGVPATGIALDKMSLDLAVGSADVLTATLSPAEATDAIVWASTDPSVATVADGTVTGVAPGATAITATAGGQMAVCVVTVTGDGGADPGPAVASVTLDKTSLDLAVGSADVLTATTDPAGATVAWASTHPGVATVTGGTVMGVGPGLAIVTATAGGRMAVCVVTVRGEGGTPVPVPSPT